MKLSSDNNWRKQLTIGDKINALDGDDIWYEAIIINESEKYLTIRFYGWSDKWNIIYTRNSERVSKLFSKVPDWKNFFEIGSIIEVSLTRDTWIQAFIIEIDNKKNNICIITGTPNDKKKWINIDSPLIAEPYTHCGYKSSPNSSERRKMLSNIRETIKKKYIYIEGIIKSNDLFKFNKINDKLSDIKFKFSNNKIICAHKIILTSNSDYFKALLIGNFNESNKKILYINYCKYNIFLDILKYIYNGKININNNNYLDLLDLSCLYLLDKLKCKIITYLKNNISFNNIFDILIICNKYDLDNLIHICLKFIIFNYFLIEEKQKIIDILKKKKNLFILKLLKKDLKNSVIVNDKLIKIIFKEVKEKYIL